MSSNSFYFFVDFLSDKLRKCIKIEVFHQVFHIFVRKCINFCRFEPVVLQCPLNSLQAFFAVKVNRESLARAVRACVLGYAELASLISRHTAWRVRCFDRLRGDGKSHFPCSLRNLFAKSAEIWTEPDFPVFCAVNRIVCPCSASRGKEQTSPTRKPVSKQVRIISALS